jgi:hypothetical protein
MFDQERTDRDTRTAVVPDRRGRGARRLSFGAKTGAAAIALLAAMLTIMIVLVSDGSEKNVRETMMFTKAHAAAEAAKPPIDEALPARIETATFALG